MAHADSRTTYERFLEFERLMHVYPRGAQPMNPTPLGYCAFALTLFVYSFIMCGATVPFNSSVSAAMGLALFYGGLMQLIAGLLEFRVGNNYHALMFCSYAGYWLSLGALYVTGSFGFQAPYTDGSVFLKTLGIFYLGWLIFTIAMLIASVRTNVFLIVMYFFLMVTFILWTAGYFLTRDSNGTPLHQAGGAIGIFTSILLWILGFASLLKRGHNSYFEIPVFSLAPKTAGTEAPVELRSKP